jgi:hypothetical protein
MIRKDSSLTNDIRWKRQIDKEMNLMEKKVFRVLIGVMESGIKGKINIIFCFVELLQEFTSHCNPWSNEEFKKIDLDVINRSISNFKIYLLMTPDHLCLFTLT